jgi:hypothetical protein
MVLSAGDVCPVADGPPSVAYLLGRSAAGKTQSSLPLRASPSGPQVASIELRLTGECASDSPCWVGAAIQRDAATCSIEPVRDYLGPIKLLIFDERDEAYQIQRGRTPLWLSANDAAPFFDKRTVFDDLRVCVLEHFDAQDSEAQVRREPKLDAKLVVTLDATHEPYELTGKRQGGWVEVRVREVTATTQCGGSGVATGKTWKGWLRLVDERGAPHVQCFVSC